jgi:valyl-tRNA synthetase
VEAILDLVRGVRNARAEAHLDPAAWLPLDVAVPVEIGETFEALRPAVARLARARPVERHLTKESLEAIRAGGLTIIVGDVEAHVGSGATGDPRTAGLERARLEKELAEAERLLGAARSRITDEAFLAKAPPHIVEGALAREVELVDQVGRLRERLGSDA